MKIKDKLILLLAISIIISTGTFIFRKKYKVVIITNIEALTFNDTIVYVYQYKDDYGMGLETRLKNYDTPFCFSGFNTKMNLYYFAYAKKGDILTKKKDADSFYITRNDSTIGFHLYKCNE